MDQEKRKKVTLNKIRFFHFEIRKFQKLNKKKIRPSTAFL